MTRKMTVTAKASSEQKFKYLVLGGGNSAGYVAAEFAKRGVNSGELAILSDEKDVSYERPTLSKAYLFPENPARLPGFHTSVGGGGEAHDKSWYSDNGITFQTDTNVVAVDIQGKTVSTEDGGKIGYEKLIIALGSAAIGMSGEDGGNLGNIFYLRNTKDADALLGGIKTAKAAGNKAVVVGAGYIGLEVGAALAKNGLEVTLVMPSELFMPRLFTKEIAAFYERFYTDKGIKIVKKEHVVGFEGSKKVEKAILKSGQKLDCDLVVVGIGAHPNVELFEGKLDLLEDRPGGIQVDDQLQASEAGVYAIGDVAAFPLKQFNNKISRQEHVAHARKSAAHVVSHILDPQGTQPYDYFPFFYSRIFNLSWQFYGENADADSTVFFGDTDPQSPKFGTYFIKVGRVHGAFLEGGSDEENAAMKKVANSRPEAPSDLQEQGLEFAMSI